MSVSVAALKNSAVKQSADADNATATATVAATEAVQHAILGYAADYSQAPAAGYKTVTFKRGTTTVLILRKDFANGGFMEALPAVLWPDKNQAVSVELQASGVALTTGRVSLFFFSS